ncbi:aspartyl-phosphate phosphatase Spo0E family protein [Bacillus timonensis]|nr:aspartyl-phosphate phosphatase Spo0E family protein [Bacillus timonensis]
MHTYEKYLLDQIELCRTDMMNLANGSSLLSEDVIEKSTRLDDLLNQYQSVQTVRRSI